MKKISLIITFILVAISVQNTLADLNVIRADLIALDTLEIEFIADTNINTDWFSIYPEVKISQTLIDANHLYLCFEKQLNIKQNYRLNIEGFGNKPIRLTGVLDKISSDYHLGYKIVKNEIIEFTIFAPRALKVKLEIFKMLGSKPVRSFDMEEIGDGIWRAYNKGLIYGYYYAYRIWGPEGEDEQYDPNILIADPYSKAIATQNDFHHKGYSIIMDDSFDWRGDSWMKIPWEDLVIYEMHVRDMTVHKSSGVSDDLKGTYLGLVSGEGRGGINALKELGVNAVELLPVHEFGNIELPYNVEVDGVTNTWNPYARNHWGYMTSGFFAPESYYASDGDLTPGDYSGLYGKGVKEFKKMVSEFHKNGIAVILDVVYNHVSQYDYNPYKYIDKKYYFYLDPENDYIARSGCGNDFLTSRPMARRLIIDSLKRWMVDFHVDGFRFDLAAMIDWETLDGIRWELTAINPEVILIAEPWGGGGYDLKGMSEHGYMAWNDVYRNTIKGQNPYDGLGLIFGEYWGGADRGKTESLIKGYIQSEGGYFEEFRHSVNYLESHDDHTLGDFIRIGLNEVNDKVPVSDLRQNAILSEEQLKLHKLGALLLFTSRGPVMMAEGQEFGRSKVIAQTDVPDPNIGKIDHNSYDKDNETNWINFDFRDLNSDLVSFYRELIALRKQHPILRRADTEDYNFIYGGNELAIGFIIKNTIENIAVLYNCSGEEDAVFQFSNWDWEILFTTNDNFYDITQKDNNIVIPPLCGLILIK